MENINTHAGTIAKFRPANGFGHAAFFVTEDSDGYKVGDEYQPGAYAARDSRANDGTLYVRDVDPNEEADCYLVWYAWAGDDTNPNDLNSGSGFNEWAAERLGGETADTILHTLRNSY